MLEVGCTAEGMLEVVCTVEDVLETALSEVLACILVSVKVDASMARRAATSKAQVEALGSAEE